MNCLPLDYYHTLPLDYYHILGAIRANMFISHSDIIGNIIICIIVPHCFVLPTNVVVTT